ncbi:MAG: hypothetical protein A3E57_03985 [Candidatus Muproteobacteria bacterium RIFCSPHIGHO2_12_FULL_60_33]|uniref:Uncharacterized protein n=1 Tax=Candidatus Muproteobacteria bacterium RIFCSPLOWO2_01_FULL_60_18 TaxID=1817768 RepID=A0A1F6TYS6_9PROT|nr:MAG: hypothetical protein A3A87_07700 [Candidatus Muproteobacteria bacterium RIFCSPLOWO2_01_FULL_60_18]OGI53748.1 MAG: hypothetical protein A3D32_04730 [Candidatus Muproteobacteria bacterium RIFCSPHIGHO2_02_FULL_60_13]OGI56048.1 MAG: hypothetical protein A3E57_03985 [Candidatus Muproteobacteria bacterium RIFCSPHIGHO2_12_FULL_60_33]
MPRRISHVIGFDDAPFDRAHRGDVLVVGAVYAGARLEGVLSGKVRRDGANSTRTLIRLVSQSRFAAHAQAILLQGIAFAGFNVIDLGELHQALGVPVIAIARKQPGFPAIRRALLQRVPGGRRKWALIEQLGPMEPVAGVFVQRAGISLEKTSELIKRFAVHSRLPEPLRTAHLIAGGIASGESRHRA